MISIQREVPLGSMVARYVRDQSSGTLGLVLLPETQTGQTVLRREVLSGVEVDGMAAALSESFQADAVFGLVQVASPADDSSSGFASGRTLLDGTTSNALRFRGLSCRNSKQATTVTATFRHPKGWKAVNELRWPSGASWCESRTIVTNDSDEPLVLDQVASAALTGLTPFAKDDASGRLHIHRFRSVWSMEGRLESRTAEELQLERSWKGHGVRCERFGVVGSMPVNGWFPRAIVEDVAAGVCWGIQINHNASWQIELYRRHDSLALAGGLADREFGHWRKVLAPGESIESPTAILTCVRGGLEEACDALNAAQEPPLAHLPALEDELPVLFNEWGAHWGFPTHEKALNLATQVADLGLGYFVIDAGWYAKTAGDWSGSHGDWKPNVNLFPGGLRATADAIRDRGLIPGLWFEMETCGHHSELYNRPEMLLHRDGLPVTTGERRHLDLRIPAVQEYLAERVIGTLREGNFGYLKIDYNETLGIGVDCTDSPGEGLRQWSEASLEFLRRIRRELPELVIENCSSGGHRLVPPLLAETAMSSFSDAHECLEIPIIAANLHRLILPRQNQIWAVLRNGESNHRTVYTLSAGFLGRLCISGELPAVGTKGDSCIREALDLYRRATPVIRKGTSRRFGPEVTSYRHPVGWQAVRRVGDNARKILVVAHTFADPGTDSICMPLPRGKWQLEGALHSGKIGPQIEGNQLVIPAKGEFRGTAVLLEKASARKIK